MNREIKFRVFDIDRKKWVDGLTYAINDFSRTNKPWHKVMQYTGLKDKNGKEIYEGDIIKNSQADLNIVHWFWDSWCYQNYHAESLPLGDHGNPYLNNGLTSHEVIGNIYENPDLIAERSKDGE